LQKLLYEKLRIIVLKRYFHFVLEIALCYATTKQSVFFRFFRKKDKVIIF